jgi:hypothetical protein
MRTVCSENRGHLKSTDSTRCEKLRLINGFDYIWAYHGLIKFVIKTLRVAVRGFK